MAFWLRILNAITVLLIINQYEAVVQAEIFTAMSEVENVLYAEQGAVDAIMNYVRQQEQKLEGLRRYSKDCHASQEKLKLNGTKATDGLNIFLLTKRLREFALLKAMVKHNDAEVHLKNITNHRKFAGGGFPQEQDFIGAAMALFRIQDTYKLAAKDLADGRIPGTDGPIDRLSAFECYELGRVAYLQHPQDYYHTLLWMQEAHDRLKSELYPSVKETDVLEHLSYAMYHQENVERAAVLARKLKKLNPNDSRVDENLEFYELELLAIHKNPKSVTENTLPPLNLIRPPPQNAVENFDLYEQLCRGEARTSEARKAKLFCSYKTNRPFLKLAPLKAEIIHLRPQITIYRQVVSEIESAIVKELATPTMARALIENRRGQQEPATYRISKSAWLPDKTDAVVRRISKRIEDIADLTSSSAEDLQIANYGKQTFSCALARRHSRSTITKHDSPVVSGRSGLGGHYEPHFDFAEKDEKDAFKGLETGNRIATVMFYLSQPLAGGSTVFPELKLAIAPSKNDAVLWYNLYKNGEGNTLLRHAACPVLAGNKWVANKWLHERDQEFLRPCGLQMTYEDE